MFHGVRQPDKHIALDPSTAAAALPQNGRTPSLAEQIPGSDDRPKQAYPASRRFLSFTPSFGATTTRGLRRHRGDIDGLRAVAILPVVLYHFHVPGFNGGFVGVDVFFVISGYLITSIISCEIRDNDFSTLRFYERRIRRIFPALLAMLMAASIVAAATMFPDAYREFCNSLLASAAFLSSFFFRKGGGYFDPAADELPLLHTWSLSVEELYYIFFPPMLVLAWRRFGVRWWIPVAIVGAVSFSLSALAVYRDPLSRAAFFLPHFRAWELMIGALLALGILPDVRSHWVDEGLTVLGLAAILLPVHFYSGNTPFPGAAALSPCLGTAAIIYAGRRRLPVSGQILVLRPVVMLGLISYSLYLWHWPIRVFSTFWVRPEECGLGVITGQIGLSILVAWFSWRFIERPFRGRSGILSRRNLFAAAGGAIAVAAAVGVLGDASQGWPTRFAPQVLAALAAKGDQDPRRDECLSIKATAAGCVYGKMNGPVTVGLWGDSHAAMYASALGDLALAQGEALKVFTMPSCPPTRGWQRPDQRWRDSCARFQELALRSLLQQTSIRTVILAALYRVYPGTDGNDVGLNRTFRSTIDKLLASGKRVVLVYPVPDLGVNVPDAIAKTLITGGRPDSLAITEAAFRVDARSVFAWLDTLGDRRVLRVYPHRALCLGGLCPPWLDGRVLYADTHHLTQAGAKITASLFAPLFSFEEHGAENK